MRPVAAIAVLILLPSLAPAADKLTMDDRIEITRGLMAEYGKSKVLLPRSRKTLEVETNGAYDKKLWSEIAKEIGEPGLPLRVNCRDVFRINSAAVRNWVDYFDGLAKKGVQFSF